MVDTTKNGRYAVAMTLKIGRPKKLGPGVYVRLTDRRTGRTQGFTVDGATVRALRSLLTKAIKQHQRSQVAGARPGQPGVVARGVPERETAPAPLKSA